MKYCILESVDNVFSILHAEAQRRLDSQYISEGSSLSEKNTSLSSQFHQLVGLISAQFLSLLIFDQLNTNHKSFSSYVTDDTMFL